MAAGSISAQDFRYCTTKFLQQCLLSHDWWEPKTAVNGEEYLCKKQTVATDKCDNEFSEDPTLLCSQVESVDACAVEVDSGASVITYEFHIVYSHSYCVPVLYFNAYKADGRLLSLEEVWERVPSYHRQRLEHERWTFLTQQEHPLLGQPFFQLHPCHTADLMKQTADMGETTGNYLTKWLSAIAPVVGLHLPLELGKTGVS